MEIAERVAHVNRDFGFSAEQFYFCDPVTHLWREDEKGRELKLGFKKAGAVIEVLKREIMDSPARFEDPDKTIKELTRIGDMISNDTNTIMDLLKSFLLDRKLAKKLNETRGFIPFTNGLYEVASRTFRPIRALDYISETGTVGHAYDPIARSVEMEAFLRGFQREPESLAWLMKQASNCLDMTVLKDKIVGLLGMGSNGKVNSLICCTLLWGLWLVRSIRD
jgi:phage/plasmid-associated DNA primase